MENLSKHKLFQIIKHHLPHSKANDVNLIEVKSGILYVWNRNDASILTLNIEFQLKHSKEYPLQILRLTNSPVFEVTRILINKTSEQAVLIGAKGIAVVNIPRRWGAESLFEGGKSEITCRCTILDERYFSCKKSRIVKQVKWHPGSPSFSHLVVLTTEDTLRLYCTKTFNLITVWHPKRVFASSSISSSRGIQTLASLGETAIDFDFMPPQLKGDPVSDKSQVEWPILILRGNGDVFIFTASFSDKNKIKFEGPLPVYPPFDDTYGTEDASSLIVLKTTPPIVAIATSNANVYHSMLLSVGSNDENDEDESECSSNSSSVSNYGLFVFECIGLELGFSLDDTDLYSSPVILHEDPYVSSRYFCTHEAGLHAVILPIVQELDKYAKCDEDAADKYLPSLRQIQSSVEYLICTKVTAKQSKDVFSPIVGLHITEYPCLLIALLNNGDVSTLFLTTTTFTQNTVISPFFELSDKRQEVESFDVHIQNVLRPPSGISRPILKLDSNVHLSIDMMNDEMDDLREEYFHRYQNAIKEIEKRIKLLLIMKENQKAEIRDIEKRQASMVKKGEQINLICQQIENKQAQLDAKAKEMLETLKRQQPRNAVTHKKVLEKLKEYYATVEMLSQKAEEVANKQQFQEKKMQEVAVKFKKSSLYLTDEQQKTIVESLRQTGAEIAELKNNFQTTLNITNTLLDLNRRL
ncbi:nuclear pore complex protein Nup88 isoform X2 [Planococcus citri]|uniref:nuclear pore complex protein Nup88 isoform X2 n=1 Tax=Planococcus citri TaxID=170843 RepID=UPI0031F75EEB